MFGTLIKTWYAKINNIDPANIVSVALMPCSAKKFECNRPGMCDSGYKDIDYGLTTRECAQMIREAGIHLPEMPKSDFDDPFGTASGSGVIFGATGGVMEAALRSVIEFVIGKKVENFYDHANIIPVRGFEGCRYVELQIPKEVGPVPDLIKHLVPDWNWLKGATLKIGVAHGTANAKKVMEDIKAGGRFSQCHFIEFMACPGGCLGGGGQPIPTSPGHSRGPGAGHLPGRRGLRQSRQGPKEPRESGRAAPVQRVSHRRPVRTQEPSPLAYALHAARKVYRIRNRFQVDIRSHAHACRGHVFLAGLLWTAGYELGNKSRFFHDAAGWRFLFLGSKSRFFHVLGWLCSL